jgi:phosphoribosylformimino-5-aminoimidazole carboxamide ribotide isomerase
LAVARAFREHFGLATLYLADLDAIQGGSPAQSLYRELIDEGFHLWIDAGVRDFSRALALLATEQVDVVVGLESIASPALVGEIARQRSDRVIFSLDLRDSVLLGDVRPWDAREPIELAVWALAKGVRRLLVLDLACVGVDGGTGTEAICRRLTEHYPWLELYAGGGVRGIDDLRRLGECGVSAALVASALHDGRLTRRELDQL